MRPGPELHWLTLAADVPTARRFILDTNVVNSTIKHMTSRGAAPTAHEIAGLDAIRKALSAKKFQTTGHGIALQTRLAIIEMSRAHGRMDREALALNLRASDILDEWLGSITVPISQRLDNFTPIRRAPRIRAFADSLDEYRNHERTALGLLRTLKLFKKARAGELRSPIRAIEELECWESEVALVPFINMYTINLAVQIALGSAAAPPVAMCKFDQFTERRRAERTCWNVAWDLLFIRALTESGAQDTPLPGVLLTYDKHLAEAVGQARNLIGSDVATTVDLLIPILRREARTDANVSQRLTQWAINARTRQQARQSTGWQPGYLDISDIRASIHSELDDLWPPDHE